jgi:hypothetical protein
LYHAYFLRQRHAGRAVRAAAATSASIHTRARANGMHEI